MKGRVRSEGFADGTMSEGGIIVIPKRTKFDKK